ncbi:MAG: glucose-1-phosphate adenylyltransferase [Candidatus Omnitrophica bacterium]|nr:glucose-1-phosphate adenylyltransferase [Candidatus Omnitrophota bacterium]
MRDILTFILAGGKGERLDPLTRDRAKPAVPFGGIYRIIDFTLSNCINSGLRRIFVLTQYKSFSLQKHLLTGWDIFSSQLGEFIDAIPPQQRVGSDWYQGTADAIYQNIYAIKDYNPKKVLILSGDHIYRMDYGRLLNHHNTKKAHATVCCVKMPKALSIHFGVIEVDRNGCICGFQEKPEDPKTIPDDPKHIYASMGIYLFDREVLLEELNQDAKRGDSQHDFGKNIIPQMIKEKKKVYAYNFADENGKPRYWRDIGTRDSYYEANLDLLKHRPDFDLFRKKWPVRTYHEQYPPIKILSKSGEKGAKPGLIIDSFISGGCVIKGAEITRSVLSPNICVENGAKINDSILMGGVIVGKDAKIKNAIIDKEVVIPSKTEIGYNLDLDRQRFAVTASGIVIVPKKASFK